MITITSTVTTTSHHHDQGLQFHEFDSKVDLVTVFTKMSAQTPKGFNHNGRILAWTFGRDLR